MISAHLHCNPSSVTAQQKGARLIGKYIHFFEKPRVKTARKLYRTLLRPHRPENPLSGSLSLHVLVVFPFRKAEPKKNRIFGMIFHNTAKPDATNWLKLFEDCLEDEAFFHNDGQIADSRIVKVWGSRPGIVFRIKTLTKSDLDDLHFLP